jgi:hypothetical protein
VLSSMDTNARPNAPLYSVTVKEAAALYERADVPRTVRRAQKYRARGDLDCKKIETEAGGKPCTLAVYAWSSRYRFGPKTRYGASG